MPSGPTSPVLRFIRSFAASGGAADSPDAQLLGLRGGIYDFRLEQVLGLDQRLLRRAAGDGQGLAELGRRLDVVDAAADQAGLGEERAVLPLMPAVADANGAAIPKLDRPRGCAWERFVHSGSHNRSLEIGAGRFIPK